LISYIIFESDELGIHVSLGGLEMIDELRGLRFALFEHHLSTGVEGLRMVRQVKWD